MSLEALKCLRIKTLNDGVQGVVETIKLFKDVKDCSEKVYTNTLVVFGLLQLDIDARVMIPISV